MTFDERVGALQLLGLGRKQSAFLVTVAVHGGFCVRRQYLSGTRRASRLGPVLLDGLVARRLAARFRYRNQRRYLYYVHDRRIYHAIGLNRRINGCASPALIARRLMLLDYVLTDRTADWYVARRDKVALFTEQFRVPLADLPQRVRATAIPGARWTTHYFVHDLPIAVTCNPAVPSFIYLVLDASGGVFRRFLRDHTRLLARLPTWTIVAVCPRHVEGLTACRAVFDGFVAASPAVLAGGKADDLREYFTTRRAVEQQEFARLAVAEIDRFHAGRQRFSAPVFESLYANWRLHGDAVLTRGDFGHPAPGIRPGAGRLIVHTLANSYLGFGSLAGRG